MCLNEELSRRGGKGKEPTLEEFRRVNGKGARRDFWVAAVDMGMGS